MLACQAVTNANIRSDYLEQFMTSVGYSKFCARASLHRCFNMHFALHYSTENLRALAEVSHFGTTDMGLPGQGPWTYRILEEQELSTVLASKANAASYDSVDVVTLQPCPNHIFQSQDRFIVEKWDLPGGTWAFNGVFDGHINHATVEYVIHCLPHLLKNRLRHLLRTLSRSELPNAISKVLHDIILQVDESLVSDFVSLFPRPVEEMSDSEIHYIFENEFTGTANSKIFNRCLGGSTFVISLTDPTNHNLWVASLGASYYSVLFEKNGASPWKVEQVNVLHSAENFEEAQRIRRAHSMEGNVLVNNRLLGFLEPTRVIGDMWLKLPAVFLTRVFSCIEQPWLPAEKLREYTKHIRTPPYASNIPDVFHHLLPQASWLLLLCTDGFPNSDSYTDMGDIQILHRWGKVVDRVTAEFPASNISLSLLRDALGGDDKLQVSRNLTVEMEDTWMDDVTVLVQRNFWPLRN
ncbi:phosphatase 2C-like domain-containing protein [Cyathus striatus]|nr:phosphatase 2C-like domain-containing protein [Cyathus striatus]